MSGLYSTLQGVTDDGWGCALIGAALAVPFVVASVLSASDAVSLSAVLVGGLVAGYLYGRGTQAGGRVGFRAGLLGAIPMLVEIADVLWFMMALNQPVLFGIVQVGALVLVAVLALGLAAVGGQIGGMVGGWLATQNGRRRSRGAEG
jgi:hypothetical protein